MALVDVLKDVQDAVRAADLDPELRPAAFFAGALITAGVAPVAVGETDRTLPPGNVVTGDADQPLDVLADRLGVDREMVDSVFYVSSDETVQLGVARAKLGRRKAEAARQVALLTAVSRQFAADEDFTPATVLRAACQDYGVFDSGNFAKTLVAMSDVFQFRGSGPSRQVRVVRPGYEDAGRIVAELAA
jgi:hypothetical protein